MLKLLRGKNLAPKLPRNVLFLYSLVTYPAVFLHYTKHLQSGLQLRQLDLEDIGFIIGLIFRKMLFVPKLHVDMDILSDLKEEEGNRKNASTSCYVYSWHFQTISS